MAWVALATILAALVPGLPGSAQVLDPPQASVSATDADDDEGNGTVTDFSFTISLDRTPESDVVVHYRTVGSTASATAGDYAGVEDATVTFPAGALPPAGKTGPEQPITIRVDGDGHAEGDESFLVELLPGDGYTIGTSEAMGTIRNDDPHVAFADQVVDVAEGSDATVPLTLSEPHTSDVEVTYSTADGDATAADGDYTAPEGGSGTVTIPAGQTTADITIPALADDGSEPCEPFTVQIDDVSATGDDPSFVADDGTATVLIVDDRTCVFVDDDVEVTEGDSGTVDATVAVRALPAPTSPVTLDFETADGTATAGDSDYLVTSGSLAFEPGEDTKTVTVKVAADSQDETRENLSVEFNLADGETDATLPAPASTATVTILDDDGVNDARPILLVDQPDPVDEGPANTTTDAVFTLSLVEETTTREPLASDEDITVRYRTTPDPNTFNEEPEDATVAGSDYQPLPPTDSEEDWLTLTIPAGHTSAEIPVTVIGDTAYEPDETFTLEVRLPQGENAVFVDGQPQSDGSSQVSRTGTITNDDPIPSVSITDVALEEGNVFEAHFDFSVQLSNPTELAAVTANYATADGTAAGGSEGCSPDPDACDYEEANGQIEIPRCEDPATCPTASTVTVAVQPDEVEEDDETFTVEINLAPSVDDERPDEPDAALVDSSGLGTILNDDGPEVSITEAASKLEGDSGTTELVFTVTLSEARTDGKDVTVGVRTSDGTATATADYAPESTTLKIPAGQTSVDLPVTVHGDTDPEHDETFTVTLSDPVNAEIAVDRGQGTGEIVNDDGDPDANHAPTAVIDGDTSGIEGSELTFEGSGSFDPDGTISEYAWAFGDGSRSARGTTVTHAFPDDGTYTVALRVTDDQGAVDIAEVEVAISNADPTATAQGPSAVELHHPATFTGGGSDPGNDVLTFAWDLPGVTGSTSGQTVEHAFTQPGTHQVTLRATDDDGGVGSDTITVEVTPDTGEVGRHAGTDRIATAVAVSAANWDTATDAVLATAGNYPDALAGGPLAARLDAPLLLTPTDQLHHAVRDELSRLGAQRVWLLGGPAALSQTVEDQLAAAGYDVHRFEGPDRFVTAAVIAAGLGPSPDGEVMITLGTDWADALSAGALAAADRLPTLLTAPTELPNATAQALEFMGAREVHLIGGTAAISRTVEDELLELGYQVNRLAGATRYGTSVAVAAEAMRRVPQDPFAVPVVFATGQKFPDGLASAALAARTGGTLLLVPGTGGLADVPELHTFLSDDAHRFDLGHVVGGRAVVTDELRRQLRSALTHAR